MIRSKSHNFECCMCGDHGLSHELFRCKVCHFRSQHRYCSNLYPKAESYRVCNWCLIQKDNDHNNLTTTTLTTTSNTNNSNSSSPENHSKTINIKKSFNNNNNHQAGGPKTSPKCLRPTSPIKKPVKSPEPRSPSGRKRITAQQADHQEKMMIIRRTKSSGEIIGISNNNNNNSSGAGQAVIKHVFRNKVRRYKLLEEVSS